MRYPTTIARAGILVGAFLFALVLLAIALRGRQPAPVPVAAVPPPADPSPQEMLEFAKIMTRGTNLLKEVKTAGDAEAITRQLDNLAEETNFKDINTAHSAIEPLKRLKLSTAMDPTYRVWENEMWYEYDRLRKIPGVLEIMKDTFPIKYIDKNHIVATEISISVLSEGAVEFRANRGNWPPTLQTLILVAPKVQFHLVTPKNLDDPWGRPIHYDPEGPRHAGKMPDIWSDGPPHYGPDSEPISNW
jgi:hypothetical protein